MEAVTNWLWFVAVALISNVLALVLLVAGLRAATAERLARLLKRAVACVVVAGFGSGLGVVVGGIKMFSVMRGESVDPSQKARILAEGISEAMNFTALGIVSIPLPIAAAVVIAVRARRLSRQPPSQATS